MIKKSIIILILFCVIFSFPLIVSSTTTVNLNLNYPSFGGNGMDGSIQGFFTWLYYMIIIIATIAAFGVIIWGGIVYLTSAGNSEKMKDGLNRIQDAVIGLLLVLLSYLILNAIDPNLVDITGLEKINTNP